MSNWKSKNGPLMIAEISSNHERDFEYAKKLTELEIQSNVDYVKFQLYSEEVLELNKKLQIIKPLKESGIKAVQSVESDHVTTFRRVVHPAMGLKASIKIISENLVYLRLNHSVDVSDYQKVIGRHLIKISKRSRNSIGIHLNKT